MSDERLYQKIARNIRDLIDSGTYPPGTRLPGERELANTFGVSRVVIREAEISLESLGMVDIRVGSGVYVRASDQQLLCSLPKASAFELTQTRLMFEPECAALAAKMITDDQLVKLEETVHRMADPSTDNSDGEEADREFHSQIAAATGNAANVYFMDQIWRMRTEIKEISDVYGAVCIKDTSERVNEHGDILNALKKRDPAEARAAMREHFSRLLEALLEASERNAIEEAKRAAHDQRNRFLSAIG